MRSPLRPQAGASHSLPAPTRCHARLMQDPSWLSTRQGQASLFLQRNCGLNGFPLLPACLTFLLGLNNTRGYLRGAHLQRDVYERLRWVGTLANLGQDI